MAVAEKIPLEPVESSNLAAIGYNPVKQILAIQFRAGSIYHYAGVSIEQAFELYGAESKGRYYSRNIRGKFEGQRMTGLCPACGIEGWVGEKCDDCGTADYQEVPRKPKEGQAHEQDAHSDGGRREDRDLDEPR